MYFTFSVLHLINIYVVYQTALIIAAELKNWNNILVTDMQSPEKEVIYNLKRFLIKFKAMQIGS